MHKNIITNKLFSIIALGAIIVGSLAGLAPATFADVANVTTSPATAVTLTDATMNGINGAADATDHSFWVSTSTFSTATPALPDGVYSTNDLGAIASSTSFDALLSSANGLPAITPATTYYFAAWSDVGGTWFPGEIQTLTTLPVPPVPSTDASLSNLTISVGSLSPAFSSSTNSYTANVDNSVSSVTVTPTANQASSTISVNGSAVVSGSASLPISLAVGVNPSILTVVTAQDGIATSTYTITITRSASDVNVITNPATGVTSIDAVLNGLNGTSNASGHSFWVSTSTFSTASSTIPAGVYSTVDFGAIASSTAFGAALSSATGIPAITASTTYYFAAWSNVGGTWFPGAIQSFTTGTTTTGGTIGGTVTGGTDLVHGVLSVTGVTAVTTTAIADGTFASGWKYVFNITVPTNETNLSMKFGDWTNGSSTLSAANNMRISSAQADNSGATVLVTGANTYTLPT